MALAAMQLDLSPVDQLWKGGSGREAEEIVFGGAFCRCDKALARELSSSLSDMASLDSEATDSTFCWQASSSTLKSDDDGLVCAPSSPGLECGDVLDDEEEATRVWAPGRPAVPGGHAYIHAEAEEALREELCKEREVGPSALPPIAPEYRYVLVHWLREVCVARALSKATLHAAVTFMDRFLCTVGEGATPPTLLQLLAITCLTVATKNEQQQCAVDLLDLARDESGQLYQTSDGRRMELHLLQMLGWRLRVPTVYTFLTMLLHRVMNRPQDGQVVPLGLESEFRALALHLAELALLDTELSSVRYSTLAVTCILVAETELKGGQLPSDLHTVQAMRSVQGPLDLTQLSGTVQRLYALYKQAQASATSE